MVTVEIREATLEDARAIAATVRDADRDEIWASHMMTPLQAMEYGLRHSSLARTGFADGVPVCMWGVVDESLILSVGIPWMITAAPLDQNHVAMAFLRRCRGAMREFWDGFETLINYVDARNARAIRWLRFMGFALQDPTPYGAFRLPFHRFEMRRA